MKVGAPRPKRSARAAGRERRRRPRGHTASAPRLGLALCRLVVPAWLLMAAVVTLAEANPHTLPPMTILAGAASLGLPLDILLATLVAVMFTAVAVMLAVGHMARPAAAITLIVVSLVLVCEMVLGNTATSGFLGAHSPPPGMILGANSALLLGVLLFDPTSIMPSCPGRSPVMAAVMLSTVGVVASYWIVMQPDQTLHANAPAVTERGAG